MKNLFSAKATPFYSLMKMSFILVFAVTFAACSDSTSTDGDNGENPPPASSADIQITVDNVGASAWEFTDIQGDNDAADLNTDNTNLTLEVGQRYRFVNSGGITVHPFGLQQANGDYLLAQNAREGSFESNINVDFESDDEGITFTLTSELAAEINTYNCLNHVGMEGSVSIR